MFDALSFYVSSALAHCSWFYMFSVLISILAVLTSICIKYRFNPSKVENVTECEETSDNVQKYGIQAHYKYLRRKMIEESLTPQQLDREKNVESQTLKTIMDLLQKRNDIFPEATMDELKEQLKLYRNSPNT